MTLRYLHRWWLPTLRGLYWRFLDWLDREQERPEGKAW